MYSDISFQRIKLTKASAFTDLASTPFRISFDSNCNDIDHGEVCFHLENAALAAALVKAINEVLEKFADLQPGFLI